MHGDDDEREIATLRGRLAFVTVVLIAALGVGGYFIYLLTASGDRVA
jgi:hypothetical protein